MRQRIMPYRLIEREKEVDGMHLLDKNIDL